MDKNPPRRRHFAFRLRTLFFVVLAVAWLIPWAVRAFLPDNVFIHDAYFTIGN